MRCFLWRSVENVFCILKLMVPHNFVTRSYELALFLPTVICLGTPSAPVQLVCEWVISCP